MHGDIVVPTPFCQLTTGILTLGQTCGPRYRRPLRATPSSLRHSPSFRPRTSGRCRGRRFGSFAPRKFTRPDSSIWRISSSIAEPSRMWRTVEIARRPARPPVAWSASRFPTRQGENQTPRHSDASLEPPPLSVVRSPHMTRGSQTTVLRESEPGATSTARHNSGSTPSVDDLMHRHRPANRF
jgi:hypothetical protein